MSDPVQRAVSIFDLKLIPGAIGVIQRNNKKEVEQLLYNMGFDVEAGFEMQECWHRPLSSKTKEAVYGVRIVGVERCDSDWKKTGLMSWEAEVFSLKDSSLRSDIMNMGREGSSDKAFEKYESKDFSN